MFWGLKTNSFESGLITLLNALARFCCWVDWLSLLSLLPPLPENIALSARSVSLSGIVSRSESRLVSITIFVASWNFTFCSLLLRLCRDCTLWESIPLLSLEFTPLLVDVVELLKLSSLWAWVSICTSIISPELKLPTSSACTSPSRNIERSRFCKIAYRFNAISFILKFQSCLMVKANHKLIQKSMYITQDMRCRIRMWLFVWLYIVT